MAENKDPKAEAKEFISSTVKDALEAWFSSKTEELEKKSRTNPNTKPEPDEDSSGLFLGLFKM